MALHRGCSFHDLVGASAFEERDPKPLSRATGMGERDLTLGSAEAIRYTAGTGPPEPLHPWLASLSTNMAIEAGRPERLGRGRRRWCWSVAGDRPEGAEPGAE